MSYRWMKQIVSFVVVSVLLALPAAPVSTVSAASASTALGHSYVVAAPAKVVITKYPGTVRRGYTASITVKTGPNANCSMTVRYKSGPSKAAGVGPKTANASGVASWSWKVGTNTTPGSWPVIVTCGGATATTVVTVPR